MPLRLLWQPRHARDVDVPFILEIVGDVRRWEPDTLERRWEVTGAERRWAVDGTAFRRWVIMEVKRIFWTKDFDDWKGEP